MFYRIGLMAFCTIITLLSAAQTATLKLTGRVLNEKNEPLPSVSIKITGAGGASTDIEGRFSITLSVGKKHELEFTAVGYESKIISDVEVMAGQGNEINLVLTVKPKTEGAVVVTARSNARRETTAAIISFQKNTNTVASVISAEAIRRSPDKNSGEILKRIPGTSVQEGKYLVVRGLSDRYNQAMLNGVQLASTEPDRKAFSFDILPTSATGPGQINRALAA